MLVMSLTHVSSVITSVQTFTFSFTAKIIVLIIYCVQRVVLTVVRVMIAKYRKSGIWGYRSSLTPEPVELK